jgi:hypothetical protein
MLGPVIAAIIAGAIAFLASVLAKENKVSELRQAWIDSLRNDLSEMVSIWTVMIDVCRSKIEDGEDWEKVEKFLLDKYEHLARFEAAQARIELRLNPDEHQALIGLVRGLGDNLFDVVSAEVATHDAMVRTLVSEGQRVLKREWRRVKRGEIIYAATKWISLALVVCAAVVAVLVLSSRMTISIAW